MLKGLFANGGSSTSGSKTRYKKTRNALRAAAPYAIERLEERLMLSTYTVTSLVDDGGTGELRWAIRQANSAGGTNTISFKAGLTGTISLVHGQLELSAGNTTITGPGANSLTVSGNKASRVLLVDSGVTASITGLTISAGFVVDASGGIPGSGGGIENEGTLNITYCTISGNTVGSISHNYADDGGGIANSGTLKIANCTVSGNAALGGGQGGGVYNGGNGTLTITNSAFSGNSASGDGGALFCEGFFSINNSTITNNSAGPSGGGISANGAYGEIDEVTGCTFSNNSAGDGGGIDGSITATDCTFSSNIAQSFGGGIFGFGTFTNCTFSGNVAEETGGGFWGSGIIINCTFYTNSSKGSFAGGGAIYEIPDANALIVITNSTISDNSAQSGGGIYLRSNADVTLYNTIVAGNMLLDGKTPSDIAGSLDVHLPPGQKPSSNNLIGSSLGLGGVANGIHGNIIGVTAAQVDLGPLQNNGGPTETMALLSPSLALGGGDITLALDASGNPLTTDQRGTPYVRVFGGELDIGAFEYQPGPPQLAFHTEPNTTTAGSAINPAVVVYIEDSNGNLLTTNDTAVTLSLLTGSLGGTATVNAVNGIATFSNLLIYTAGTYELQAVDGTIPAVDSTSFIVNPAAPAQLVFAAEPTNANAGAKLSPPVVVYEMDAFGNIVRTDTSTVNLSVQSGPGGISGTAGVALSNGAAVFSNISFNTAGTYTLIARDGSLSSVASSSFQIAGVNHLVFATEPTNADSGAVLSPPVVVYEMDALGNIVRTDTSTVNLSVDTGPGGISGTAGVALNNGAAVFSNISFNTAGTYTIIAQDGSLMPIVSSSFQIAAVQTQYHLVFASGPTNTAAGAVLNPPIVVYLMDSQNNIIRNNTSMVTLSVASGPGAISGTISVAFNNGAAVFSNISFPTAGTYTITARDGSFTPITSSTFTISGTTSTVAHLAFVQNPTNIIAGVNVSPNITVKATDVGGKIVGGVVVTLEISSGPAGGALFGKSTSTTYSTGIAAFGATTFHLAGTYTLTASVGGVVSASSTSFTVSPAAANKSAFTTLPASPKHATAFTVKVSVEDIYGNVLTTQNTGTITLALATHPTGSTLGGTLTANVVNGVATFSTLTVSLAGTYTLKASDSFGITAATSAGIVVS